MKDLMIANKEVSITSLDIANLLGSQHGNVKRSIDRLMSRGVISQTPMEIVENNQSLSSNNKTSVYVFTGEQGKRDSIIVVAQLSPEFTAALVDRWKELEEKNTLQLPNFNDPVEAARAWADAVEARQIAQQKLEEAKPAIEFVDKYVQAEELYSFRQVCKLIGAKENAFRKFLVENKIMYKLGGNWTAYAQHLDADRFKVKAGVNSQTGVSFESVYFTAKGVEWIAGLWAKNCLSI